jgi:hypothetical protein
MKTLFYSKPPNTNAQFITRLESERTWLLNKVNEVKQHKLSKRPRAVREIRDLEYQIRRNELDLAFNGPEWAKYEKYAMWELLKG